MKANNTTPPADSFAESRFRENIRKQVANGAQIVVLPPRGMLSPLLGVSKEARVRILVEEI